MPLVYRRERVIAVSPSTADEVIRIGFDPSKVRVIYNGVLRPPTSQLKQRREGRDIVYVGRLKRYKRIEILVKAVDMLRATVPRVRLHIVGEGDARTLIERLVDGLGLQEHVVLHGHVDDAEKTRILCFGSVFATASLFEGWGLSVIEANACGCPAVAYDVPGLRSAIRHGETGILATDDASFIRALTFLLENEESRARYSEAALRWASHFSWESCAQATLDVLRGSEPAPPPSETESQAA